MSKPILSVVVPVYNTRPYLGQCLHSLAMQTLADIEVIMVNDGSTDGSDELLKKRAIADRRFRYVEQMNGGLSVARNTGMMMAQGTYIAFLDSDDWLLTNDCLDRICQIADGTEADIVAGNTWSVFTDGRKNLWGKNCKKIFKPGEVLNGGEFFVRMEEQSCYVPMVYNYVYRRSFLQKHQFRFEPGVIHEDELWTPQVLTSAQQVVYTEIHHYGYRQREGSIMTTTSSARRMASLQLIVDKLLQYVDEYTNTEADTESIKKAIEMNILRLYWIACSIRKKNTHTTLYDKAGQILSICQEPSSLPHGGRWYHEHILLLIKDFFNELQTPAIRSTNGNGRFCVCVETETNNL